MSLVDTVPIDYKEECDKETKSTVDWSSENYSDEKSSYSQASIKSKTTGNEESTHDGNHDISSQCFAMDSHHSNLLQVSCDEKSSHSQASNKSKTTNKESTHDENHEISSQFSAIDSHCSNLLQVPCIINENEDYDDEILSMNSEIEEKLTKEMELRRLEQQLIWKEEEMQRREEKNRWKEESIEQWTSELAHREKELDRRDEKLTSREMDIDEQESNLSLIREELNLGEMDLREYLKKQESIAARRDVLKSRSDSMKEKNHEAMERLMKIARSDRSVTNIEELFKYFDLPVNLNERLSENVYLELFKSFFRELKLSESMSTMNMSSSSLDSNTSSQINRRSLLRKYKLFEAKMFFLLTERDVVILNLKRKLVEKDQDTLAKEYAIRHKDVTDDDINACKEAVAAVQNTTEDGAKTITHHRGSIASVSVMSEISKNDDLASSSSSLVKVNGYIKSRQSLERRRVELLQNMSMIQKKNEDDLVKRVEYLKEKESNMLNKDEHLTAKETELRGKEEELKNKRELLSSLDSTISRRNSISSIDFTVDRTKPLQMENLNKSIQISMRKDEEAVEALKSEQLTTECAAQELRTEAKKKDDEILKIRLSLMKKKVFAAFLSKQTEPSTGDPEPTAEERKEKRAYMKKLEEESAHMKNIILGLDASSRALKLDIKKREDLMRKKKKLGKSWTKVAAKSQEPNHDLTDSFLHMTNA